ncbi:DUF5642 family protein [Mycobacterium sp.]|uniref:DUF5642 family protein n=1 Tax=Mycobacterium sp. TaxID=1785 RepID=UPI003D6A6A77
MSTGVRCWIAAMVALLVAACANTREPPSVPSASPVRPVNPANIKRVGREFPPGYEVAPASGIPGPPAIWGLGGGWTADPPRCAALADPAREPARGIAGSGAGGIGYALVTAAPAGSVAPDPALVAECPHWIMTSGRATARVQLIEAPRIDGGQTVGMTADTSTLVEGENEIASRAITFIAYLGSYYAFTVSVTDPGSPQPPLPPQSVADLLVKTVAALRS